MTIQKRILLIIVLVIFICGLFAVTAVYFYTKNVLLEREKVNYISITSGVRSRILQLFSRAELNVETIASQKTIIDYAAGSQTVQDSDALRVISRYKIDEIHSAIYIINTDGVTITSTDESFLGQNYGFRDYFKTALQGSVGVDAVRGVTSGELGYYFSHPITTSDGTIEGVVVVKVRPDYISQSLTLDTSDVGDHVMFVDKYGVIVYSDIQDRIFKSLGALSPEQINMVETGRRFTGVDITPLRYDPVLAQLPVVSDVQLIDFYDENDKDHESLSVSKIGDYPFYLVLEKSTDALTKYAIRVSIILVVMILLAILLAVIFISLFIVSALRPLHDLYTAAVKIGKGDYSAKVTTQQSSSDLQKLSEAFNAMTQNIKQTQGLIEQKVREQTKELFSQKKNLENQQTAIMNVLDDIEQEKAKAEELAGDLEKFKLAVENASDQIVITDADGILLYANKALQRITGYDIATALGKKAGTLWALPMPKEFYGKLWDTIKNKKEIFQGEIMNRRKNGEKYTAMVSISPILDKNHNVRFFVGIERDITHEKEVDKAKTEFVSLASHQLRTPLSAINWYTEMLLAGDAGKVNKNQHEFLKEIYTGNKRMVSLVNSLLNVSRIELGTFAIEPEMTNIQKQAEIIIKELQPEIKRKKLSFVKKISQTIPQMRVDPKLLNIIFQNLLSNAVKYTPKKGKIIFILRKTARDLVIQVKDTGYGIPKIQQHKIFTKLFRADNVQSKDTEGTGLGLYIIKSILDQSGGSIAFTSKEGKGTTFTATIPLSGMKQKAGTKGLS